jgi:hypothetical protein
MKLMTTLKISVVCFAIAICMAATGGCGTAVHKASVASGTIAASLRTAATVNHSNTLESAEERTAVANFIAQAAAANDDFVGKLQVATANGGTLSQEEIYASFETLLDRVDKLEESGILKIKDPTAQKRFANTVETIRAQLVLIESLFPAKVARSHRGPSPSQKGQLIMAAGLTLIDIERLIELLTPLGASAVDLIEKLIAMKGKTDEEILEQASVDNAEAIRIAEEDGADLPAK